MGIGQLTTDPIALGQELYISSSVQKHPPGQMAVDGFGRTFRYVKAGAVTLVTGNVLQGPVPVANHLALVPVAAAIDAYDVTVALGATALTENYYAGGNLVVQTTPGLGFSYPIEGHPAADASASVVIRLGLPIRVALTTTSRVDLSPNAFRGVIQAPVTTATADPAGGCVFPIVATEWGWIQTGGDGAALITGTPAVGQQLTSVGAAAGALAIGSGTLPTVAIAKVVGVDTKVKGVRWIID